jgi:phosphoribosylformimino-5-aminoimidazole carboxamide ribotide isomerase
MKKFKIIPAIDIIDGECVRLSMGDYTKKRVYGKDPAIVAKMFMEHGFKNLHIVDLQGAKSDFPVNTDALRKVAAVTTASIQFGGGIKSLNAAGEIFRCGADKVICGSIAVENPQLFIDLLRKFGGERVILGADIREGKIAVKGWQEQSDLSLFQIISEFTEYGLKQVICTDISKDGMLQGPAYDIYRDLKLKYPGIEIIASGGVSSLDDIVMLYETGANGVIAGKAFYENRISYSDLKLWLQSE